MARKSAMRALRVAGAALVSRVRRTPGLRAGRRVDKSRTACADMKVLRHGATGSRWDREQVDSGRKVLPRSRDRNKYRTWPLPSNCAWRLVHIAGAHLGILMDA